MLLNRLFSDTIYQLMWDTKKSENILMCVRCPSAPPWSQYQYVQRSDAEGRLHVLQPFVSKMSTKMKQNAITMNNNNESKYIQVKACIFRPF